MVALKVDSSLVAVWAAALVPPSVAWDLESVPSFALGPWTARQSAHSYHYKWERASFPQMVEAQAV